MSKLGSTCVRVIYLQQKIIDQKFNEAAVQQSLEELQI